MQGIFFAILIFSIILHEVSHGYIAEKLGDKTARLAGRITLNPLVHIDMLGSIILPVIAILAPGGFLFGWAKPVPYNPYNFTKMRRLGEAIVAGAGPATNFALALMFALFARLWGDPTFTSICFIGVLANLWLGCLNLIQIPPLDGSKVLGALLPSGLSYRYEMWRARMEHNPFLGFGIIIALVLLFGGTVSSFFFNVAHLLIGA